MSELGAAPLVFISDASAEAERGATALRAHGYVVADVPLALLPGRVAVQLPSIVICDADAEGAEDALRRIRDAHTEPPVPVIVLCQGGGPGSAIDPGLVAVRFTRPLNVSELVATVERLVGAGAPSPPSRPLSTRGSKGAMSSRPPMRLGAAPRAGGDHASRAPGASGTTAAVPLPPDLAGDPAPREVGDAPAVELSEEIQALLLKAERRLGESRPAPGSTPDEHGPEVEAEGPLPPEVLMALEEPLDDEDLAEDDRTPEPQEGTGLLTTAKAAVRGNTQMGGAGTGSTFLGTDAGGAPSSERHLSSAGARGARAPGVPGDAPERRPEEDGDQARRSRQQASTPKPPKPTPEDLAEGASMEPPPRVSLAPPTVAQNALPESSAGRRHASESPQPEGPGQRSELSSTTPPARPRGPRSLPPGERQSDRPEPPRGDAPRRGSERPEAPVKAGHSPEAPIVLRAGDAVVALAKAIGTRYSGVLAFEVDEGIRRVVLRDGDFVTVASGVHGESLVAFLAGRGDVPVEVLRQGHKLPAFGRRAGAALIAHGHLGQDQLWPVLRSHAEWLVGRVLLIERGTASTEEVGRLQEEPAVFGGATGAEILVEVARRVVRPEDAIERIGGPNAVLGAGRALSLLGECALSAAEAERVQNAAGSTLHDLLAVSPDPSLASALYALVTLGVLSAEGAEPKRVAAKAKPARDELDEEALRSRILARKALVDDGDYFAVLGVPRDATAYDIRRAYTSLRRELTPSSVLTPSTADLGEVVDEIVEVLDEAYQILSDQQRRDRYRRAIDASP